MCGRAHLRHCDFEVTDGRTCPPGTAASAKKHKHYGKGKHQHAAKANKQHSGKGPR
jgi:hypothetical protein